MLYYDITANARNEISSWPCHVMKDPNLLKCFSTKCFPVFCLYVRGQVSFLSASSLYVLLVFSS